MKTMNRSEFMKCCTLGMCSCVATLAFSAPQAAVAQANNPEADRLKSQLEAVRIRYAKLVSVLDESLDEPTRKKILESLGRECAKQFGSETFEKYRGDIKGFLKSIQEPGKWVEKAEFDEAAGSIRIIDKAQKCSCPLVEKGLTPSSQCDCTLGWQKETYSAILGKPVEAEVEESILRGGQRCVFRIKVV
ncbi:MAG TPA: hypothetical protein VN622_10195 [Clostridia bacterium]|nr:hypothetical protein [Clostridia bacterium]